MKKSSKHLNNFQNQNGHQGIKEPTLARPQKDESASECEIKEPWCKRDGHNRMCLTCGKSIKTRPGGCPSSQHQRTFRQRQAYNKQYRKRNQQRLLQAHREYRAKHPELKIWQRRYHKKWYQLNRARKLQQSKLWEARHRLERQLYLKRKALEWYHAHRQRAQANNKRWYRQNRFRKNSRRNELLKAERRTDVGKRILFNFRTRLSTLVRVGGVKGFSITREILLYTGNQLRNHLENQFTPLMNWMNYAQYWEVDHIRPCKDFDLTELNQCRECFALENLRPLPLTENRGRCRRGRYKADVPQTHL